MKRPPSSAWLMSTQPGRQAFVMKVVLRFHTSMPNWCRLCNLCSLPPPYTHSALDQCSLEVFGWQLSAWQPAIPTMLHVSHMYKVATAPTARCGWPLQILQAPRRASSRASSLNVMVSSTHTNSHLVCYVRCTVRRHTAAGVSYCKGHKDLDGTFRHACKADCSSFATAMSGTHEHDSYSPKCG
jgi:hypothetical protein